MTVKLQLHVIRASVMASLLYAGLLCFVTFAQAEQKNKLADFKSFGQWEIWCIDMAQSGNIVCNLNQVLRYKNHPDFRAMIPRFFTDGNQITRMEIDREWQTGFSRGYIQVDDHEPVSLSDCDKPCIITGVELSRLVEQFRLGEKASIRFHDFFVEEFDVDISLKHFDEAISTLMVMQP